jgi:hypothetical protein
MASILALSVRQPWAWAIIHAGKDLENRKSLFSHRGLTLIHASAGMSREEYDTAIEFIGHALPPRGVGGAGRARPHFDDLKRGGIIGAVEIIDAVTESTSPWWMGPRALVLRNPIAIPFIPCRGTVAPLFWTPDADTLAKVAPFIPA